MKTIKNLFDKSMEKIGYVPIKIYKVEKQNSEFLNTEISRIVNYNADLIDQLKQSQTYFDLPAPKISFEDFKKINKDKPEICTWSHYWEQYYSYNAICKCAKQILKTDFYVSFIDALHSFDFNAVEEYMKKVNWKWSDKIPSINSMKETCYELAALNLSNSPETNTKKDFATTGGFSVCCYYDKGEPKTIIKFSFNYTNY